MMLELTKEQLARVWLQCAPMNAWNKLSALKARYGSALGVWERFPSEHYDLLGPEAFSALADSRASRCAGILRALDETGAYPAFYGEDGYPAALLPLDHPPDVLFIRGKLPPPGTRSVAVVGARACTRYGLNQARRIAKGLGQAGVCVVSGLARGIDGAAHQGALDGGGPTVAVLGSGVNRLYPPENKELAQRILASGGAIVSELHPEAPPLSYHFPVRNRIIAGLSDALLLIEARQKSGTHSTVQYALSQGKEVFALPGNVDAPGSELPLMLLREGAGLCACAEDIISSMGWDAPPRQESFFQPDEEESADPILRALMLEEKTVEELIRETGLSAGELGAQLTLLEISGKIERRAGRAYALVRTS